MHVHTEDNPSDQARRFVTLCAALLYGSLAALIIVVKIVGSDPPDLWVNGWRALRPEEARGVLELLNVLAAMFVFAPVPIAVFMARALRRDAARLSAPQTFVASATALLVFAYAYLRSWPDAGFQWVLGGPDPRRAFLPLVAPALDGLWGLSGLILSAAAGTYLGAHWLRPTDEAGHRRYGYLRTAIVGLACFFMARQSTPPPMGAGGLHDHVVLGLGILGLATAACGTALLLFASTATVGVRVAATGVAICLGVGAGCVAAAL